MMKREPQTTPWNEFLLKSRKSRNWKRKRMDDSGRNPWSADISKNEKNKKKKRIVADYPEGLCESETIIVNMNVSVVRYTHNSFGPAII